MKTELKAKFLQHLIQKKNNNEGFTLIELLVVIIIIGILAAIALPSFLNQANKARESEAKTYVGSMNRGQQAYFLEQNAFVGAGEEEFAKLGIGISQETNNYKYEIKGGGESTVVTNLGVPFNEAGNPPTVRAYAGGVATGEIEDTGETTTFAVLCQAIKSPAAGGTDGDVAFGDVNGNTEEDCTSLGGEYEDIQ